MWLSRKMAILKSEDEQLQRKCLDDRLEKYTKEYNRLKARKEIAKNEESRNKILEKMDTVYRKMERTKRKYWDMYYMCLDYELSPFVNIDMVNWYLEQVFPASDRDPFVASMIMLDYDNEARRMMGLQSFKKKAANLLSLNGNTYISHCQYVPQINRSQRNKRRRYDEDSDFKYRGPCKECVHSTQAIVVDLDYRDTEYGYTMAEDFYEIIKESGAFDKYGEPSFCVVSSEGQGLQMVYLLTEPFLTYFNDREIYRYEKAVKGIIDHFRPFGADSACGSINHLFRVPCSYNIRTKTWGYLLHWERLKDEEYNIVRYAFEDFEPAQEKEIINRPSLPPTRPVETPKRPGRYENQPPSSIPPEAQHFGNTALRRCADLRLLVELRQGNMESYRDKLLFIYTNQYATAGQSNENLLETAEQLNNMFTDPLANSETKRIVQAALKKRYRFTDDVICEMLDISENEILHFQTIKHPIPHTEVLKRYRARHGLYKNTKERVAARNKKIIERHQEGATIKQLAAEFELTKNRIYVILRGA